MHLVFRSINGQNPELLIGDLKRFTSQSIIKSNKVIQQKIDYVHNNPVEEGIVFRPEDYKYSSGVDYAGEKGLIDDVIVI